MDAMSFGSWQRAAVAAVLIAGLVPFPVHAEKAAEQNADAMAHMLRADRDKDGVVSRAELEAYDLTLARRFKEADADRDGKLTLKEFETLLPQPQSAKAP